MGELWSITLETLGISSVYILDSYTEVWVDGIWSGLIQLVNNP